MASTSPTTSFPREPIQLPSAPKLFKTLSRSPDSHISKQLSSPRATLNLPSSNIKLSVPDSSSYSTKKLTTFRTFHNKQKRKESTENIFTKLFSGIQHIFLVFFSAILRSIRLILLLIFQSFKHIFETMIHSIMNLTQKILPLYPDKWIKLCSWLLRHKVLDEDLNINHKIHKKKFLRPGLLLKKPLTLVVDLDETLIHSSRVKPTEGAFETMMIINRDGIGQQIYLRKRPHLTEFLEKVAKEFNIVIFTASRMEYADPIIDLIDQDGLISHRFYRDSCSRSALGWVKDLAKIEIDMKRVLLLDNCKAASTLQPENHLIINSWFHDEKDTSLQVHTDFLLECARKWKSEEMKNKDLRAFLRSCSSS